MASWFKPIYSPHHQNYQHLQDLICIEFWGIKLVKFCVFPQTLTETDKCMYVHNFRKSNHSQRTCKQLKNKTKTKVCILEKLMRGGLSSRSSIIPWGMPQQRGGIRPTSCVTPRRVPRKKDTPNNSPKEYFLEYSRVFFAQNIVFTKYYKKGKFFKKNHLKKVFQ